MHEQKLIIWDWELSKTKKMFKIYARLKASSSKKGDSLRRLMSETPHLAKRFRVLELSGQIDKNKILQAR